jgi:uncharacterized protein YjiS (DUF1127 family)
MELNRMLDQLRESARKRTAYKRTVWEIENMPLDAALDLGIYRGDAHRLAHKAVYG